MDKALQAKDPIEAKSILNSLRTVNAEEWQECRADVALEGLRAKFGQNQHLCNYLFCTRDLKLGEASKNPVWGIGMTLEDEHVLDSTKWKEPGNLLGNLLMQVRAELTITEQQQI